MCNLPPMKTLYLIRHAKSSWAIDGITDRDRPLKGRGIRDAHLVSQYILKRTAEAEKIQLYSSSATRALHTALIFAKNLGIPASQVNLLDDLYLASEKGLESSIANTDEQVDTAFYFAHNPGITEFVNKITNANIANVPTTGLVCVRFDVDSWKEISSGGELIKFEYPKRLKEKE